MVKSLSYLKGPSKKIQGRRLDLYDVVNTIREAQDELRHLGSGENSNDFYEKCYNHALRIGAFIGIEQSMPQAVNRQMHRNNTSATI